MSSTTNDYLSSTSMEIILDDHSSSESNDEESQLPRSKSMSNDEETNCSPEKSVALRNPKSHRLIEKRRRDRLNRSLAELLDLVPHKKPENHRRIEKIEIIDMSIKYIRNLIALNKRSYAEEKADVKVESYRHGYQHGTSDTYEFLEKYSDNRRLHAHLLDFIHQRESEMSDLTNIPEKKNKVKSKKLSEARCDTSQTNDELCAPVEMIPSRSTDHLPPVVPQPKVPSFVLHPSGTHYIPVCLDASVVAEAFPRASHSRSPSNPLQCHPVSIPVNFHTCANLNESYALDIQNINVIGSIHQTSVRPH